MIATNSSGYVAISRRTLDLEDYIDVARRHVVWILGPVFAGLVISTVVAFLLQNTYVSKATLQITPKQVSDTIVKTTISQDLTERIGTMQQEIMSRASLSSIITDPRLDLYKEERASQPLEDVIETMRNRDVHITIDSLPGEHRVSAFQISFDYRDRTKAHDTVQNLIAKFQEANLTSQRSQQNMVGNFVKDELTNSKAKLDALNETLTKFKSDNAGKLPEQTNMNMAAMASLQQRLGGLNDALNRAQQERVLYEEKLATLNGQMALSDSLDKELAVSPPVLRQNQRLLELNKRIQDNETQLMLLRHQYRDNHPDIRVALQSLNDLKKERDDLQKQQDDELAKPQEPARKATNFQRAAAVSQLDGEIKLTRAQMQNLETTVANEKKDYAKATAELQAYETKLAATSGLEARYADLTHEIQEAREHFNSLERQQQLTEQNGELLSRQAGEHLDVLDPPSLPVQPSKPNRWAYVGGGTAIAFILGLGLAGLQEAKDTSLKNLKDVRAYTNLPVLSSIPLLENTMLVRRKRRITYLAWSAAVIIGILAVSASLYYHYTYAV